MKEDSLENPRKSSFTGTGELSNVASENLSSSVVSPRRGSTTFSMQSSNSPSLWKTPTQTETAPFAGYIIFIILEYALIAL
jgi:hypothetical protein